MTSSLLTKTPALEYDKSWQYRQHYLRCDCLATKRSIIYRACSLDVKKRDGNNKEGGALYCMREDLMLSCLMLWKTSCDFYERNFIANCFSTIEAKIQTFITDDIHSFSSLSYERSKASSKVSSPYSAIQNFLFQMRVSSHFLKVI
jgi:hypothetical protein